MPSKHVLANREANSRHTYDVTIWLSRTTDNSNIFIRSREVRDNEQGELGTLTSADIFWGLAEKLDFFLYS